MFKENTYWFYRKRYGWGWGRPAAWQGWVVYTSYFLLLFAAVFFLTAAAHPVAFTIFAVITTLVLVLICWLKGEPPRWQWGEENFP